MAIPPERTRRTTWQRWSIVVVAIASGTWWSTTINADRLGDILHPASDPYGYYQYLPATQGRHNWEHLPWTYVLSERYGLCVYSMGTAMLQAPFYFAAEAIVHLQGGADDGYGRTHAIMQALAAVTYFVFGLAFVFDVLRRWYGRFTAWMVVLGLGLGTNLFFYSFFETGMSHAYAFFLTAWLVRLTVRSRDALTPGRLYGLLVCSALVVLVRPLNIVLLLFPLLYGMRSGRDVVKFFAGAFRLRRALMAGVLSAALLWAPQLWYWHLVTGHWVISAYAWGNQFFHWSDPHPIALLFSPKNGWFLYTPLMFFAVAALIAMAVRRIAPARLVLLILALTWWLYASWWCWWLGSGFGHRGFIEHLPLLALPLAWGSDAFVQRFRRTGMVTTVVVTLFLCYLNVGMSYLYTWPWDSDDWTMQKLGQVWEKAVQGDWRRHWHP